MSVTKAHASTRLPTNAALPPYALLPGDPGRVDVVAGRLQDVKQISNHREFRAVTGTYRGLPIICMSTGIGCPSTAIAMEELARCGVHTFFRIGTCGSLQDHIETGDLVVFDSALRADGTTLRYAPLELPAVADHDVVSAARSAGRALGARVHVGTTRTADTFYAGHPVAGGSFNSYWQSSWENWLPDLRRMGVAAAEMEASAVLLLSRLWGLRGGGAAVVLDQMLPGGRTRGPFDPLREIDRAPHHVDSVVDLGLETLRRLAELDANNNPHTSKTKASHD